MFKFNRFPLCSLVYFEAAKMLGYDDNESASLAQGRAAFFAAAKMGFKNKNSVVDNPNIELVESLNFAGMPAFILPAGAIEDVDGIVCCTRDGDKIHESVSHFKSEARISKSVGISGLVKLKAHIQNELSLLGDKIEAKDSVYKVYVKMRDSARHEKFYEDVLLSA